jgi:signal transduction histidine kinase
MLSAAARDRDHLDILRRIGFTSAITVPLQARGRNFGALSMVTAESRRRYTQEDVNLAMELGHRAGAAVDNARLYTEALAAQRAAEEANAAKTSFLASMSHELRTPLNAIGGYAELLAIGVRGPVTEDQRRDLERIRRSQRHLLSLINEVLNYAKVEAGRIQYDLQDLPLAGVLEDLDTLFHPQMRKRRVEYRLAPVDAGLKVRADPEKLQQVLLNLMSNAVKYTQEGGKVDVNAEPYDGWVIIEVKDEGPGIPTDKLEAVFEPFVQLRYAGAITEGTGLGLAISRDLARGMGGDLTVESSESGSIFTLKLPKA